MVVMMLDASSAGVMSTPAYQLTNLHISYTDHFLPRTSSPSVIDEQLSSPLSH